MVNPEPVPVEQMVECAVCLKEIPRPAGRGSETEEYVAHFCGLECYQEWHAGPERKTPPA